MKADAVAAAPVAVNAPIGPIVPSASMASDACVGSVGSVGAVDTFEAADPVDARRPPPAGAAAAASIGEILAALRALGPADVERVLVHQRRHGLRFGEAAVALGYATDDDVLQALARQFDYPYAASGGPPSAAELVALSNPFSPRAEIFRVLRSQLTMRILGPGGAHHVPAAGRGPDDAGSAFDAVDARDGVGAVDSRHAGVRGGRALAVISPDAGDGRTYVACNLAVSLAQLGGKTLLLDADLRTPRVGAVFGLAARSGLSGLLVGRDDGLAVHPVDGIDSLFVLPVGTVPPNPLELVERPAFAVLLRELSARYDHIVVDTPAASHGADAAVIASRCGAALLLARRDTSRVDALRELLASLAGAPVRIAGVVANDF